jgi:hypothetical protein
VILLGGVSVIGTVGYMLLERWSALSKTRRRR